MNVACFIKELQNENVKREKQDFLLLKILLDFMVQTFVDS